VANTSVSTFDSAGRTVASAYQLNGVPQWHTTSTYDGDRVTTAPPNGGTATAVITNGLGQKTNLLQYKDPTKTGPGDAADVTSYTYNNAGLLSSTTDPTGKNVWTTSYDLHGNKIASTDPDVGAASYSYDLAGQLQTTTDGRGKTLAYTYDGIGRKTGEYAGSTSGPQLAGWTYDTLVKGLPSSSARYDNGNAYTTSVYQYDTAGCPLATSPRSLTPRRAPPSPPSTPTTWPSPSVVRTPSATPVAPPACGPTATVSSAASRTPAA
jgi:YD repeat-containing protein